MSPEAALAVQLSVTNMPDVPATTGYGRFRDETSSEMWDLLASWRHLGGVVDRPRYSFDDVMSCGTATVQLTTHGCWRPEAGSLVTLSEPPLCVWAWRIKEAEPDLRQGGWVYTLVTSNGRAHLLDKQATWRNGRWGPVWVPSVNSSPPPSRLTSRTSLLDAMRPGSAASLSEASAGAGRGSGAASPSPSPSPSPRRVKGEPFVVPERPHKPIEPFYHSGMTFAWPGQQRGTYRHTNVCVGKHRLTTLVVLLDQDRPAVGSIVHMPELCVGLPPMPLEDGPGVVDVDSGDDDSVASLGTTGPLVPCVGLGPGAVDNPRYRWHVIGYVPGYATSVVLSNVRHTRHHRVAWSLEEKKAHDQRVVAEQQRRGRVRGASSRLDRYMEPLKTWSVVGYAHRPGVKRRPPPRRPPPPGIVPYSAKHVTVPGPPREPKAANTRARRAAEKVSRDLRQTWFVPGLADALLIAANEAGDDALPILERAAKYGMYVRGDGCMAWARRRVLCSPMVVCSWVVCVAVCGFSDSDGEDDDMQAGFNALLGGGRLSKPPKVARTQVGTAALEATLASTVDESGAWIHPYRRPGAERPYKSKKPWEQHEPLEPPPIPNFGPNLDVNPDTGLVR